MCQPLPRVFRMWGVLSTRRDLHLPARRVLVLTPRSATRALNERREDLQKWLRHAFQMHCFSGPWEGDFPRYVWCKVGDVVYEARLVNRGQGQYKGWQLEVDEWPDGIEKFDWLEMAEDARE